MTVLDDHAVEILRNIDDFACAVVEHERQAALLAINAVHLEATGAFGLDGTVSMNAWLRNHLRMTPQRAGELLATGRFLDKCAAFAEAAIDGSLSASQIAVARRTGKSKYDEIMLNRYWTLDAGPGFSSSCWRPPVSTSLAWTRQNRGITHCKRVLHTRRPRSSRPARP